MKLRNMIGKGCFGALFIACSIGNVYGQRIRENFDRNWSFHRGDIAIGLAVKSGATGGLTDTKVKTVDEALTIAYHDKNKAVDYNPKDWEIVNLPHDWCVSEAFVNDSSKVIDGAPDGLVSHGFLPVGIGFYRKEFVIPAEDLGKKISIDFDGIFRNSTVWVNGHLMGSHASGYIPSSYDLTDVLRYGEEGKNVVLVKVDGSEFEGWWYEGCGIYRHVWLVKTHPVHVARFGTFITTPEITTEKAEVKIQTTLLNETVKDRTVTLISQLMDEDGKLLDTCSDSQEIPALNEVEIKQYATVSFPRLWSPETPHLYKVITKVEMDGTAIDSYETTFGVRTAKVTKEGFMLNGKLYPIKGTSNHQDFAGVGVAVPDQLNEYRIRLLKEMGCNGYRTAHHPPTPELLDICDRMGMLVMDENRMLSSTEEGLRDLKTLILRDRNHPSVIMWSLENEEFIQGTVTGARILQTMANVVRGLDSTRQLTAAINKRWNEAGYADAVDVVGYNYGQRENQYVRDHERYPERLMIASESASFVSTRGEYKDDFKRGYVSCLGNGIGWGTLPAKDWADVVKYPYLSGQFSWTGFDYRGEPTPIYRWPTVTSHFGIMDLCGFPKDAYYAYKAAWTDEDIVHLFPHWNWEGHEGEMIHVAAYTNCEEVELFVNGKSVGRKKAIPYERLDWKVVYQAGKIEARGYRNQKLVTTDVRETTGNPQKLTFTCSTIQLQANGTDVSVINIAVCDKKGRVVPYADPLVKFTIEGEGRILGTGNGNPSSHESDVLPQRKAFHGLCQVIVQAGEQKGQIHLKAEAEGMECADIILDVK